MKDDRSYRSDERDRSLFEGIFYYTMSLYLLVRLRHNWWPTGFAQIICYEWEAAKKRRVGCLGPGKKAAMEEGLKGMAKERNGKAQREEWNE